MRASFIRRLLTIFSFSTLMFLFLNCGEFSLENFDDVENSMQEFASSFEFSKKIEVSSVQSLSRFELLFAAQDLLQAPSLSPALIADIPADQKINGFESAASQNYNATFVQSRLAFAELIAEKAVANHAVINCFPGNGEVIPWLGCIRNLTLSFAEKAFRRPISETEELQLKSLYEAQANEAAQDFNEGTKELPIANLEPIGSTGLVTGWALDPGWPDRTVEIHFYLGSQIIGTTFARNPRPDVNDYFKAENYKGNYGFQFQIPATFADGQPRKLAAYAIGGAGRNPAMNPVDFKFNSVGQAPDVPPQISTTTQFALRAVLTTILISPSFQLREVSADPQFRLASKLSFFLTGSIPDAELLSHARLGDLARDDVYQTQVSRLIKLNSERFSFHVLGQWFGYRDFAMASGAMALDQSMAREATLVFKELIDRNLPVESILRPGFTFVDPQLAAHYGLPAGSASGFAKVITKKRGGILSQGSLMRLTSPAGHTKPIVRGKWVQWNLLCKTIPTPSASLFQIIASAQAHADPNWSVSERLENHRKTGPVCFSCHKYMDPLGLALENFGPTGLIRSQYEDGKPVITDGVLDDKPFRNSEELTELILDRPDFRGCIANKLLTHGLSRALTIDDIPLVNSLSSQRLNIRDLIEAIALSPTFKNAAQESP